MTAQPHAPLTTGLPDKDLRAIRAALVTPQDLDAFDADLKATLDEVRVGLNLGALREFLHRWWIHACGTAKDPDGRRRMWEDAETIMAGGTIPGSRPAREVLAELGIEPKVYKTRARSQGSHEGA